jgi:hypothetical protein
MKTLKKTLLTALTFSLVMGCSKPEDTRTTNENVAAQANAEELRLAEQEAAKILAESKAAEQAQAEKTARLAKEQEAAMNAKKAEAVSLAAAEKAAELEKKAASELKEKEEAKAKAASNAKKAEAARLAAEQNAASKKAATNARLADEARLAAQAKAAEALAAKQKADQEAEASRLAKEAEIARIAAEAKTVEKTTNKSYDFASNTGDKTPVGAQRSGNAAGTIPAWTGGITKPPSVYKPGDHHQDPFAGDKVLFTIDGSNYSKYKESLSVGQIAMFAKYPDTYKMNVYQTRRSASFPQRIYEKTIANGKTGKLSADGEGVEDVAEGFPFPNPKNAYELILNHKLKFKGSGGVRYNNQVAPTVNGRYTVVKLREELLGKYYIPGNTIADINNILLYFYQEVESPARLAGRILLVHETMNQKVTPRQAWIYNPGQRRVRRAPNVAYDNPGTASDGLRTNDMTDMFNGAMDRFDWSVVGKKEMYVPYNSYKVHSGDLDYSDIVRPGHLNTDLMRYELHRVWIVEANLKEGMRHINSRRTFYLDEDSYQIMLTDHYDKRGNIWRFSEAHSINYYDVPTFWTTIETHHDLRSGRYVAVGLDNKDPVNTFNVPLSEANYTPQALRKRGRR